MDLVPARAEDTDAIEAFLARHASTSMFLRSNLRSFGPCGDHEAAHATRMWLHREQGRIAGVLGLTNAGMVLTQFPFAQNLAPVRQILADREITGLSGGTAQAGRIRETLGLGNARTRLDEDEPLYELDLAALRMPPGETTLRAASDGDAALLVSWRTAYAIEMLGASPDDAATTAQQEIASMTGHGRLQVLEGPDGPVAMTAFNATLPDMVQIGNVYTPPELRGQGHARRAVALHLAKARADGVATAILFASGPPACRAYEAIGFSRFGSYTLVLFDGPQRIGAPQ